MKAKRKRFKNKARRQMILMGEKITIPAISKLVHNSVFMGVVGT